MKNGRKTVYRLADYSEKQRIIDFVNANFDMYLPLVNNDALFEYYYHPCDQLQFCIAEIDGEITAATGYIRCSRDITTIWVSIWVAKKGFNGAGLGLMNSLKDLTGASLVACNNIRPDTRSLYEFMGWTAERIPHYYRVSPSEEHGVCMPDNKKRLPVSGDLYLREISISDLDVLKLPSQQCVPVKDLWYIKRRYFEYPFKQYRVFAAEDHGECIALVMVSDVNAFYDDEPDKTHRVLRLVDMIGDDSVLPRLGLAFDQLLLETGADYIDCYNYGIPAESWISAGFSERLPDDDVVIPNYLTSVLRKNTEYYFFTDDPDHFRMFKADGDQDRPNIK